MDQDEDELGDLIPEDIAIKRGLNYEKNARGHVCSASVPHPFVIDQLLADGIISTEQRFYAVQFISMRKVFLRGVATFKTVTLYTAPDHEPRPVFEYPIEDNDYLRVLRLIPEHEHREIVTEACNDHAGSVVFNHLVRHRTDTRVAFNSLSNAIKQLVQNKKAYAEAFDKWLDESGITPQFLPRNARRSLQDQFDREQAALRKQHAQLFN